ncbi:MAG: nuclear transport factor 2 family protein [Phycisphaeraceae bacterium]|nr:nuclear transport factor 2 family protein [Phycisphaeraceae bacterium]
MNRSCPSVRPAAEVAPIQTPMQNALQLPDAPPPLAEPLGLGVLLFEQPWIFMATVLTVGFFLCLWFKRRGNTPKGLAILTGAAALAGLLFLVAKLVVTDHERVAEGMRELLRTTARVDTDGLAKLLAPQAKLYYFKSPAGLDREGILAAVRSDLGQTYRVKDWGIQELQIAPGAENTMHTQMRVRVTPEAGNFPHVSWWTIEWAKTGDEWKVTRIEPIAIQFFQGNPGGR